MVDWILELLGWILGTNTENSPTEGGGDPDPSMNLGGTMIEGG